MLSAIRALTKNQDCARKSNLLFLLSSMHAVSYHFLSYGMQCHVFITSWINPQNRKFTDWQKWFQWKQWICLRQLHISNNLFWDGTTACLQFLWPVTLNRIHYDPPSHILTHQSSKHQKRRGGTWFTVCNHLHHPWLFSGTHSSLARL